MDSHEAASILIVEDDQDIARLLRIALEMEGFQTSAVHDGAVCLSVARTKVPDLVLLDIDMPVMNGLDALKGLRADAILRDVPVMMVTASGHPAAVIEAMELGADDYVTKPFDAADLVERVRTILAMDRAAHAGRRSAALSQLEVFARRRA